MQALAFLSLLLSIASVASGTLMMLAMAPAWAAQDRPRG
jgi:hypothetical protein